VSGDDPERIDRILDVLLRLAAGDLAARAEVAGTGDNMDALAAGINMLAEEIDARVTAAEHAAEELRRQVSERSRQLADALAAISAEEPRLVALGDTVEERYQVVRELGSGGMGSVHEVVRLTDGRRLAMKTLHGRVDRSRMARFAREAQIATELRHPNLVPVVDLGVTPSGMMYLVMELVDGSSLEDERASFGRSAWALPILAQVATGLVAIHERGIVHRDLKPANVLLSRGVARIADFGIASLRSEALAADGVAQTLVARAVSPAAQTFAARGASPPLTERGAIIGTPAYLAPELLVAGREATRAADVFSFGVLAGEMIAGRSPFVEPPFVSVVHGRPIVRVPRARGPEAGSEGVAEETMAVLDRCLCVEPGERPSAAEVRGALGRS
jgi:serine/threonine-protein kinase